MQHKHTTDWTLERVGTNNTITYKGPAMGIVAIMAAKTKKVLKVAEPVNTITDGYGTIIYKTEWSK